MKEEQEWTEISLSPMQELRIEVDTTKTILLKLFVFAREYGAHSDLTSNVKFLISFRAINAAELNVIFVSLKNCFSSRFSL